MWLTKFLQYLLLLLLLLLFIVIIIIFFLGGGKRGGGRGEAYAKLLRNLCISCSDVICSVVKFRPVIIFLIPLHYHRCLHSQLDICFVLDAIYFLFSFLNSMKNCLKQCKSVQLQTII